MAVECRQFASRWRYYEYIHVRADRIVWKVIRNDVKFILHCIFGPGYHVLCHSYVCMYSTLIFSFCFLLQCCEWLLTLCYMVHCCINCAWNNISRVAFFKCTSVLNVSNKDKNHCIFLAVLTFIWDCIGNVLIVHKRVVYANWLKKKKMNPFTRLANYEELNIIGTGKLSSTEQLNKMEST